MISISTNYRRIDPAEVPALAAELADAWKDESIPQLQYDMAVKPELEAYRRGQLCAPFLAFRNCLRKLPLGSGALDSTTKVLDVGASGGYYSEVIEKSSWRCKYTGIDFSPAFKELAERLYPGIKYDVGDARALPYPDNSFEIILHGAVLMHTFQYWKAIYEAVRVSSRYVIFHRTPVIDRATEFWEKEAYGKRCIEIMFNEYELVNLFEDSGLDVIHEELVVKAADYSHKTYLCEKRA